MKKIPTLFKRDFSNNGQIIPEYSDGTEWVQQGEGKATRKYDGTSVLIRDDQMYKRYELKPGKEAPYGFEEVDHDPVTGKRYGWVEVGNGSEDKYFREAWANLHVSLKSVPGTYELVGPKVQGNPEKYEDHRLIWHEDAQILFPPVEFEALKAWLTDKDIEGIVWHHPDDRMVKIKKKDYRLKREPTQPERAGGNADA
jgi:hypothetical protein